MLCSSEAIAFAATTEPFSNPRAVADPPGNPVKKRRNRAAGATACTEPSASLCTIGLMGSAWWNAGAHARRAFWLKRGATTVMHAHALQLFDPNR